MTKKAANRLIDDIRRDMRKKNRREREPRKEHFVFIGTAYCTQARWNKAYTALCEALPGSDSVGDQFDDDRGLHLAAIMA